jgi:GAF domain-containing protein
MASPSGQQQLDNLLEVRNALLRCRNLPEVIELALEIIHQRLNPQVASIFLISKAGFIERRGIKGTDKNGQPIPSTWFAEERYQPGESFSGKAVASGWDQDYGSPQWSNCLDEYEMQPASKAAYLDKLGYLKYGMSVPLNGADRTFGTLEVLNKIDAQGQIAAEGFQPEDIYWLTIVGMNVATVISDLRTQNFQTIFARVTQELVKPHPTTLNPSRNECTTTSSNN